MCSVIFSTEVDGCHPLIDEPGILTSAYMNGIVGPTWEDEFVEPAAAGLKPCEHAAAKLLEKLELNEPTFLLQYHNSARANPAATDNIADFDFDNVASTQLAVDGEVEQRAISWPPFVIKREPDCPKLLRFERALGAKLPSGVPWLPVLGTWIVNRVSHDILPFGHYRPVELGSRLITKPKGNG